MRTRPIYWRKLSICPELSPFYFVEWFVSPALLLDPRADKIFLQVMAHYTRQNVSVHTKELSKEIFEVWASLVSGLGVSA